MTNQITHRFLECLEILKTEKSVRSYRQFAQALDFHPQSLNEILRGKRNVTINLIEKAVQIFDFNPNYLCAGKGAPFCTDVDVIPEGNGIVTVVTDADQKERIIHVPVSAQAGYGDHIHNPVYFQELKSFTLPDQHFQTRTQRCFDVSGDSMEPSISSGEKIICSFVDADYWATNIKTDMVYVIVSKEEILVKRVVNKLESEGKLILISDNPDFEDQEIHGNDLLEVWIVTMKLSNYSHAKANYKTELKDDMSSMKGIIDNQSDLIDNLNKTIERLIKQNRVLA